MLSPAVAYLLELGRGLGGRAENTGVVGIALLRGKWERGGGKLRETGRTDLGCKVNY